MAGGFNGEVFLTDGDNYYSDPGWRWHDPFIDSTIVGMAGNDTIYGNGGHDVLWGDNHQNDVSGPFGDDLLYGGTGNDQVYGQRGNDELYGNEGKDHVSGGKGNDALIGGPGDDHLFGDHSRLDRGRDSFHFLSGDGWGDRVHDYNLTDDVFDLTYVSGLDRFSQLNIYNVTDKNPHTGKIGTHAYVNYGSGGFHVEGVLASQLNAGDFWL